MSSVVEWRKTCRWALEHKLWSTKVDTSHELVLRASVVAIEHYRGMNVRPRWTVMVIGNVFIGDNLMASDNLMGALIHKR